MGKEKEGKTKKRERKYTDNGKGIREKETSKIKERENSWEQAMMGRSRMHMFFTLMTGQNAHQ